MSAPLRIGLSPVLLAALALVAAAPSAARAGDLERKLLNEAAPKVFDYLKENKYENVGVLKFIVKKHGEPTSDNVGPLNLTLAGKLEIALVLANKDEKTGILKNASEVAKGLKDAGYGSDKGRARLFADGKAIYPLAWGNKQAAADAFVTGCVWVSKDLRTMTVAIMAFGKKDRGAQWHKLAQFDVPLKDEVLLIEMGETFSRGLFDGGKVMLHERNDLVANAQEAKDQPNKNPILPGNKPPITLRILYSGKRVPLELRARPGSDRQEVQVPEPDVSQKVVLVLTNNTKERVGAVLMVNGLNTLFREKKRPELCTKWVLDPGEEIEVEGFHTDDAGGKQFVVRSPEESKAGEVKYGEDVGTLSLTVFREDDKAKPPPAPDTADQLREQVLVKNQFPSKDSPKTLDALQAQFQDMGTKGLFDEGHEDFSRKLKRVPFKFDPTPILSATVRYYNPQDLPK